MEIYPAVDLYKAKVVRLERGNYESAKVYSEDPGATAKEWADQGARWLHVVDLEGARRGELKNAEALQNILLEKRVLVQFGGGVRQPQDIKRLLDWGVRRVILGTKGLDADFLEEMTQSYGNRLALSLDLRGEALQVEGWLKGAGKTISDTLRQLRNYSVECLIVTDIDRDGTLRGMNLPKLKRILNEAPFPVICSGGIASLSDLEGLIALKSPRLQGVIIGKALYERKIDLKKAFKLIRSRGTFS